ncbi:hypothetical protein [Mucilaginibacter paludis]|uniref:Uncharacterized protein n=1 Tax=Mucilaginibacter paludis DSM 18603 TaxID=714943 RepID=H1YDA8_9SPHI|nr:hypothetical protein [Mucilaginibacter paludis]EHQ27134.1 hypothetical protein Mucpa_3028 [Mucilaginibacter paludis DSM 18603]
MKNSLRSQAVENIIHNRSGFILQWSFSVFFLIPFLLLFTMWFMKFPMLIATKTELEVLSNNNYKMRISRSGPLQYHSGDKIKLTFDVYPFERYGFIEGRLENIYPLLLSHDLIVEISIPKEFTSNNNVKFSRAACLNSKMHVLKESNFLSLFLNYIQSQKISF